MSARSIHLEIRGALAQLVLDRPDKRNALSAAMWRQTAELVGAAGADPAVKVLILRGASAEAFSAGADIAEFDRVHASAAAAREYHALVAAAYEALAGLTKPTIAMVQGACFGGGCALALCCDLRYADPSARFCIPPARLGLTYTSRAAAPFSRSARRSSPRADGSSAIGCRKNRLPLRAGPRRGHGPEVATDAGRRPQHKPAAPTSPAVAALLPGFWIYWEVGKQLLAVARPGNPYQA